MQINYKLGEVMTHVLNTEGVPVGMVDGVVPVDGVDVS